jgi:hypothetical protein
MLRFVAGPEAVNVGFIRSWAKASPMLAWKVHNDDFRFPLENFEVEPLPVHLLHAARDALPAKLRVFLDFAAGRLREGLSSL